MYTAENAPGVAVLLSGDADVPGPLTGLPTCNRRMVATNWPNPAPGLAGPYSGNPPWW